MTASVHPGDYKRVVVPVDCSELAWTGIGPACQLAEKWGADLEVMSVVHYEWEVEKARADIERYLAACGSHAKTIVTVFESHSRHVADLVATHVDAFPGSFVVMTSHGRGRSAAVFGSVAERLLQLVPGPMMVFGPSVDQDHVGLTGRMLVCVDGTETSEAAVVIASQWAQDLDMEPWVVAAADQPAPAMLGGEVGEGVVESNYPRHIAEQMSASLGRPVNFDTLHGRDAAKAVADYAKDSDTGLIVAATHGRSGFDRLTEGSIAMNIVHYAPCPVVLIRAAGAAT